VWKLDVSHRCARTPSVTSRPILLLLATAPVACTVLNSMDGYTGGTKDTGTAVVDSAVVDTSLPMDTAMPVDTSMEDTEVVDSGKDTFVPDSGMVDSIVIDSAMDSATTEVTDTAGCGLALVDFGLSEFQVRGTFGTGDKREWIELTNYGTSKLDISGVTVKVFSGSEKASFTFPAGTMVDSGGAVVVVGDKALFTADVMTSFGLGTVFDFAKSDYIVNSAASEVRIFGPGCASPYETAVIPSKMYTIGQPWAYPAPTATCPASARLMAGGALGAAWKEVPASTTSYGSYATEAGMTTLYGTPTKPNNVACP
jgi:hypothetical protein